MLIKPVQPFFVLETSLPYLKKSVLNTSIAHFYSFMVTKKETSILAVPDASIDIIFKCDKNNPEVNLFGSTLTARRVTFVPNICYFGVRFMPGEIPGFLNISHKDLLDSQVNLTDITSKYEATINKIVSNNNFNNKIIAMMQLMKIHKLNNQYSLAYYVKKCIDNANGDIRIDNLERMTRYSAKHIYQSFKDFYGMSPKTYSLIIRFQLSLYKLNRNKNIKLTNIAIDLGYSDQSHFLREFKKFTTLNPKKYYQQVQKANYWDKIIQV